MARFDVYPNPESTERRHTPYLVDAQNDYIDTLSTRVVIPLRRADQVGPPARHLNPAFTVAGTSVVLDTAALAAIPADALRRPVSNLRAERAAIQDALDTLFGAY